LKLKYDEPLSNFAFNINLRRYSVVGCAIHTSNNRAINAHGCDGLNVTDNVVYKNMGHAFFIEDGVETNNTFVRNLGRAVQVESGCLRILGQVYTDIGLSVYGYRVRFVQIKGHMYTDMIRWGRCSLTPVFASTK